MVAAPELEVTTPAFTARTLNMARRPVHAIGSLHPGVVVHPCCGVAVQRHCYAVTGIFSGHYCFRFASHGTRTFPFRRLRWKCARLCYRRICYQAPFDRKRMAARVGLIHFDTQRKRIANRLQLRPLNSRLALADLQPSARLNPKRTTHQNLARTRNSLALLDCPPISPTIEKKLANSHSYP